MSNYVAALTINGLRLAVSLGVGEGEREKPQAVDVDIRFYFPSLPECAMDDDNEKYICYDTICTSLVDYVAGKEFKLLEYLTMDLHRVVRHHLEDQFGEDESGNVKVWICLHKCNAPVPYMTGGAKFIFSDLPLSSDAVKVSG